MSSQKYTSALATASAVLAAKMALIHLATVRSRVMSNTPAQKHDGENYLGTFFKCALLCFGPDFGGAAFVEKGERLAKGCAENEPFFLAMAIGVAGSVPAALGATLINVYTIGRCAHSAVFLLGDQVNTAFRAVPFVTALGSMLGMAGLALTSSS